ncbi:acetylglutamate kinase [Fictibacillus aquaticus]|uniref:acetylglutamate kinase n=1 Tax=Fictibacillus aquaticus TaxID=2021314 RepID=UPI0013FDA1C8|nr:acetylglutamate kinase [Fictibacillus aquaticus]
MRHVIKAGGSVLSDLNDHFYEALAHLKSIGQDIIIVHGGGPHISAKLDSCGIPFEKVDGIRVTSKQAMKAVEETLAGSVNTSFVRRLNKAGFDAVGLSGSDAELLQCSLLDESRYGMVGKVEKTNGRLLRHMLQGGFIPVISSIGMNENGDAVNINADVAAEAVALAVVADQITFISDVEGLMENKQLIKKATRQEIQNWIQDGTIYGGMIPKVEAALNCLDNGIKSVSIAGTALNGTTIQKEGIAV